MWGAEHVNIRARNGFYYDTEPPTVVSNLETGEPLTTRKLCAVRKSRRSLLRWAASAAPMCVKVLPSPSAPPSDPAPSASCTKTTVSFLMTIPVGSVQVDPSRDRNALDLDVGAIVLTSDTREAAECRSGSAATPSPENLQQWRRESIQLQEKN
jgi:hypothetical protein